MPYYDHGTTGLVGSVAVTVLDATGAVHVARTTAGISEPVAGSGIYYVAAHDATVPLTYVWDVAGEDYASEEFAAGLLATAAVAAVADAVWDEPLADHVALGSTGLAQSFILSILGIVGDLDFGVAAIATLARTALDRLGGWTGTGINTVLGAFKALFRTDATLPSDIGGTFDSATDSVEAIRDALLSAQAVRDAMKLAPTTGDPAAGSVDKHLDDIQAKTGTIGAGTVTAVSPVVTADDIALDQGYDYYASDGRAIAWTDDTPATWPDLTDATATWRCGDLEIEAVITNPTGPATITLELSSTNTAMLDAGEHPWKVDFELSNGHLVLQIRGTVTVSP